MVKTRILVVDDELSIIKFLRANLEARGYEVLTAMDGAQALQVIEMELPDLVILDIMMPKMDGFEVCRRLREWSQIPIIMLSARGDEEDKVKCLNLGADDYITKPFSASELTARVSAVLRRTQKATPTQPFFASGDLKIDFAKRQVTMAGREVKLTPTEYALLQELTLNAGKVLTHTHLLNKVWGPEYQDEREYLHVFIRRLRAKLEPEPTNPSYILTVPGVGYLFRDST
ncbi:MAG TPA: response regulator transcription factor [Dehalococcoidia bacterium]|jgi:two-component system KDP operon response regulator KdpE|nr:response regulator transcription factor [Dehalococcoidia bacterium]